MLVISGSGGRYPEAAWRLWREHDEGSGGLFSCSPSCLHVSSIIMAAPDRAPDESCIGHMAPRHRRCLPPPGSAVAARLFCFQPSILRLVACCCCCCCCWWWWCCLAASTRQQGLGNGSIHFHPRQDPYQDKGLTAASALRSRCAAHHHPARTYTGKRPLLGSSLQH